jgi:uncharacterized membrane protein YdbT with pleckstrin-like domain
MCTYIEMYVSIFHSVFNLQILQIETPGGGGYLPAGVE